MINPNTPFLNANGTVSREWLMFFYALSNAVGGINDQPDLTSLLSTMDENFSATIEIEKAVDAQRNALAMDDALWARVAELKNSLDTLADGNVDGHQAWVTEAQKAINDVLVQLVIQADNNARLAELEKHWQSIESVLAFEIGNPSKPAANIQPWTTVTPLNGFTLFNISPYQNARYQKDAAGFVHLEGLLSIPSTISNSMICTLPAGFCPAGQLVFPAVSNNAFCRVDVFPNGNVSLASGGSAGSWLSLGHIVYQAA